MMALVMGNQYCLAFTEDNMFISRKNDSSHWIQTIRDIFTRNLRASAHSAMIIKPNKYHPAPRCGPFQ